MSRLTFQRIEADGEYGPIEVSPENPLPTSGGGATSNVASAALIADSDGIVAADSSLVLLGYSVRETASTPAVASFNIVHGATVGAGSVLIHEALAASEAKTVWFGGGIAAPNGLSIDHISGQVDVVLFYHIGG